MVLANLCVDNIYLITGYTDMRKSVPGLVAIIVQQYQIRPDERSAFGPNRLYRRAKQPVSEV